MWRQLFARLPANYRPVPFAREGAARVSMLKEVAKQVQEQLGSPSRLLPANWESQLESGTAEEEKKKK